MKKIIFTSFIMGISLFASEPPSPSVSPRISIEKSKPSQSFFYIKALANDSTPANQEQVFPGIGMGYRFVSDASALDISLSDSQGKGFRGTVSSRFLTFPKVNYLYYFSSEKDQSFYTGTGLSWGIIRTKDRKSFRGIIPNITLGYEMNRDKAWRTFTELAIHQGAIPAKVSHPAPGPLAELSIGAGF